MRLKEWIDKNKAPYQLWLTVEPNWYMLAELAEFIFEERDHTYINSNGVIRVFLNESERIRHIQYLCNQIGMTEFTF